jgi:hypothetical protein
MLEQLTQAREDLATLLNQVPHPDDLPKLLTIVADALSDLHDTVKGLANNLNAQQLPITNLETNVRILTHDHKAYLDQICRRLSTLEAARR